MKNRIIEISQKNKVLDQQILDLMAHLLVVPENRKYEIQKKIDELKRQVQDNFDEYISVLTYQSDKTYIDGSISH